MRTSGPARRPKVLVIPSADETSRFLPFQHRRHDCEHGDDAAQDDGPLLLLHGLSPSSANRSSEPRHFPVRLGSKPSSTTTIRTQSFQWVRRGFSLYLLY